jgi:uncharacterized protein (DUF2384 family)
MALRAPHPLKRVAAEEVFDDRGRVLGTALAAALDVSLGRLAKTAQLTERALRSNPASERLQKPGRKIAVLLARLDYLLASRRSTLIWLKSPRPQLEDASPLDLLIEGDFASVETLVNALETGQPI